MSCERQVINVTFHYKQGHRNIVIKTPVFRIIFLDIDGVNLVRTKADFYLYIPY